MREFQSLGINLGRKHLFDWLIVLVLIIIIFCLNAANPFHRFVGKEMMADFKYPHKPNTVPSWAVPIISVVCPVIIFLGIFFRRKDVYDLHHAILGLLFSVLITGIITDAIKNAVGRPRPDFFWRCFPDGIEIYDVITGNVICHGLTSAIKDGHKSFPSGHTSYAFAGLGFVSLYLAGKIKAFDQKGHVAKLCLVFLPLLIASLVGISRIDDYRHHWQDVFVGGIIGFVVAVFCYSQFFPPPYHPQGWGPYAYFEMLERNQESANRINEGNQQQNSSNGGLASIREEDRVMNELEFAAV